MPRWVMILIGSLIGAGALAGLLFGVLTHSEPGLLRVCWVAGQAVYDGPCEPKVDLEWAKGRMPLRVYLNLPDASTAAYRGSITGAVEMWNQHVGQVFSFVDDPLRSDVTVTWGAREIGDHAGGCTRHMGGPELADGAAVRLQEPSDVHAVMRYAAHELGHVLGLDHDEAANSIMYPFAPSSSKNIAVLRPTDADVKLLRGKYR